MATTVLPPVDEAAAFAVAPDSITWQRAGDARALFGAGAALLMQVSHPTVAGGVREHSDFVTDPWGRLFRTLDFTNLLVYGGPDAAAATGRAIREIHKTIKGVDPSGRRYHALEPAAYAWVHATLAEAIVASHARFGRPFTAAQTEEFWAQWRGLGRLLGVRDRDLPEGWAAFQDYLAATIDTELEDNDVVRLVLDSLTDPASPPIPLLRGPRAWRFVRAPATRTMRLATVGLIPPALRARLGLSWTAAQDRELRVVGAVARATTPVLPGRLRAMGPGYLKLRREAIGRGPLASAVA